MANIPSRARHAGQRKISLAEKAYNLLIERLMTRQLAPGMFVNRRELAAEFKMSVAPVLEAIVQLQAEGFLESLPRKGTLVRAVDFDNLRGQFLLREALECEAARLYCGAAVRRADNLGELAREADAGEKKTFVELWKAESAFHSALIALTNCHPLIDAYRKVMQRKLFASVNLLLAEEVFTGGNHQTLIAELKTDNADKAEKLVRAHLRQNKERLLSAFRN